MRIPIIGELYLEMESEFLDASQLGVTGFEGEAFPDKVIKELTILSRVPLRPNQ